MSDTTDRPSLRALHDRRLTLQFQAVELKARIEEIGGLIALLEAEPMPRGPGRPRRVTSESELAAYGEARANPYPSQYAEAKQASNIPIVSQRGEGGTAGADAALPSLDDVRGILRTDNTEAA